MGTSLFNTTPQATYPSLIKLGDNLPLTATLKALSDGLGNDSVLALSTTSLRIGGQSSFFSTQSAGTGSDFFYSDINPTLTAGANNQIVSLLRLRDRGQANTGGFTGTQRLSLIMENSGGGSFPFQLFSETGALRIGYSSVATPTAKVEIKGSGSTSATTSLLVQNSSAATSMAILDNGKVGIGTSAPTNKLEQQGGGTLFNMTGGNDSLQVQRGGITLLNVGAHNASIYLTADAGSAGTVKFVKANGTQLMQISDLTTVATINGIGSTSATTSLLVKNSSGTAALTVKDDLSTTFGGTIGSGGSSNLIIAAGNASVEVQTTNPNIPTGSIITTGAITRTDSGVKSIIDVNNAVTSTAASFNTLNGFAFTSTISQTLGTIRGIYIAPTLTASTDFRAVETTVGNVLLCTTSGNVGINQTTPTARLQVKGSGSTSATNSLLVQNGAGSNLFRTRDDGNVFCEGGGAMTSAGIVGTVYGLFGGASFETSASLVCGGTTTGFLPPRMTTAQKNAIATPATGLVVYDSTLAKLCVYTTAWETITSL